MTEETSKKAAKNECHGVQSAADIVLTRMQDILAIVFVFQDGLPHWLLARFLEIHDCGRSRLANDASIVLPPDFRPIQCADNGQISCNFLALEQYYQDLRFPLHIAIAEDEREIVQRILSLRPNLFTLNAVTCAVNSKRMELFYAMYNRWDPQHTDRDGISMVLARAAIKVQNLEVLVKLHEWGYRFRFPEFFYAFHEGGCKDVVEFCAAHWSHEFEDCVVDLAIKHSCLKVVRSVPQFTPERWETYGSLAANYANAEVVKEVVDRTPPAWKIRVMLIAKNVGNTVMFEYILDQLKAVDGVAKEMIARTPSQWKIRLMQIAKDVGNADMVEYILDDLKDNDDLRQSAQSIAEKNYRQGPTCFKSKHKVPCGDVSLVKSKCQNCLWNVLPLTRDVANFLVQEGVQFDEYHIKATIDYNYTPTDFTRSEIIDILAEYCDPKSFQIRNLLTRIFCHNDSKLLEVLERHYSRVATQDDIDKQHRKLLRSAVEKGMLNIVKFLREERGLGWHPQDLDKALYRHREEVVDYMMDIASNTKWIFPRRDDDYCLMFQKTSLRLVARLVIEDFFPYHTPILRSLALGGFVDPLIQLQDHFQHLDSKVFLTTIIDTINQGLMKVFKFLLTMGESIWSQEDLKKYLRILRDRVLVCNSSFHPSNCFMKIIEEVCVKYFPLDELNFRPMDFSFSSYGVKFDDNTRDEDERKYCSSDESESSCFYDY